MEKVRLYAQDYIVEGNVLAGAFWGNESCPLDLGEHFSLGEFEVNDVVHIWARHPGTMVVPRAFWTDPQNNIHLLANKTKKTAHPNDWSMYALGVLVRETLNGLPATKAPMNTLRLLEVEGEGKFSIWEIALTSQGTEFFLSIQRARSAQCFRDGAGQVVCPLFSSEEHRWPQLLNVLGEVFRDRKDELLSVEKYVSGLQTPVEDLAPHMGRVVWYNRARQFGLLATPRGPATVHWSEIRMNPPAFLVEGKVVMVSALEDRGSSGNGVFRAVGVIPFA